MNKFYLIISFLIISLSFDTSAKDNKSIINDDSSLYTPGKTSLVRIKSIRAVVYADENMLVPLGYIPNGKAIRVGNPRRINRSLVPTVINGRVAYVEIKDLSYEDKGDEAYYSNLGAPREHDVDLVLATPAEELSKNNSLYLTLHSFQTGNELSEAFANAYETDTTSFTGLALQVIHRQAKSNYLWGAEFQVNTYSESNIKLSYYMFSPIFGYTIMRNKLFLIDLTAGLDLTISADLERSNPYERITDTYIWGPQFNARAVLFPENKYHLVGGIGYRKYSVSNTESLLSNNNTQVTGFKNISGVSLFIGVAMEFR